MKICEKCAVSISGDFEKCPLCQNTLAGNGTNEHEPFPFVPLISHKHSLFFRLLQLCSAIVVILSVTVNLAIPKSGFWSLFVVAGMVCVWINLLIAVHKRHNILKNLTYQVTVVSILSVLWDIFTGWHKWSVDFVIPIAFIAVMTAITILARILKMSTGTYIIYSFLLILYGIVPVIFILSGLSAVIFPSLFCVAGSLISLTALLVFEGRNMAEELKRRLHL